MCLGDVGRVVSVTGDVACVETTSGSTTASLAILRAGRLDVSPGDWVIVSMGFALDTLAEPDALALATEIAATRASSPDDVGVARAGGQVPR